MSYITVSLSPFLAPPVRLLVIFKILVAWGIGACVCLHTDQQPHFFLLHRPSHPASAVTSPAPPMPKRGASPRKHTIAVILLSRQAAVVKDMHSVQQPGPCCLPWPCLLSSCHVMSFSRCRRRGLLHSKTYKIVSTRYHCNPRYFPDWEISRRLCVMRGLGMDCRLSSAVPQRG